MGRRPRQGIANAIVVKPACEKVSARSKRKEGVDKLLRVRRHALTNAIARSEPNFAGGKWTVDLMAGSEANRAVKEGAESKGRKGN